MPGDNKAFGNPRVSGDKVVYNNTAPCVFLADLSSWGTGYTDPRSTSSTTNRKDNGTLYVNQNIAAGTSPDISGRYMVWKDGNNIKLRSIDQSESSITIYSTATTSDLKVSGDKVVWSESSGGSYIAKMYSLSEDSDNDGICCTHGDTSPLILKYSRQQFRGGDIACLT